MDAYDGGGSAALSPLRPWDAIGDHARAAVIDPSSVAALSTGLVATAALSAGEADHEARVFVLRHGQSDAYGDLAVVAGYVAPIVAPALMFGVAGISGKRAHLAHASAMTQALALTFVATSVLKGATGRPFPLHGGDRNAPDRLEHPEYAREWNPFNPWRGWAWPSGHASLAFAAAASIASTTRNVPVAIATYAAATAVGAGVLVGDHHWTSDVVAGALLGQAIGGAVGRGFCGSARDDRSLMVLPMVGPGTTGVRFHIAL